MNSEQKIPVSMSWSGGKDSAFALWQLQQDERYEVLRLHTTFGEQSRRVGMHGIDEELIEMQAESIGLPLDKIYFPSSGDNQAYEAAINSYLDYLESKEIRYMCYGDIFLEDLRKYREDNLARRGFSVIFPLWKIPTETLAHSFIQAGFKTKLCAADADLISSAFVGKDFDLEFLNSLPESVDPCGENGEFHSFCYEGPIFKKPISIQVEKLVQESYEIILSGGEKGKKHYWFAEIIPSNL